MTQPTPNAAKIKSLDGLRGVMALWVVFGHVSLTFGWRLPLIDKNTLAVDVFVLLSGFVITMLIERKAERYGPYIVRRAFRLFPLYFAALAVSAVLLPVQAAAWRAAPSTVSNLGRLDLVTAALEHFPFHVAAHLPLAQGLVPRRLDPQAAYTIIGQAWSISLEWQFYLLAPVLLWSVQIADKRKTLIGVIAVALLLVTARFFSGAYLGGRVLHFLLGIVSFYAMRRAPTQRAYAAVSGGLALAIMLVSGLAQIVPLAIWGAVLWSAAQPAHSGGHAIARTLSANRLVRLGEISFSIYLIHMIPLYCSITLLGYVLPIHSLLCQAAVALTTVGASCGLAVYTYRWIEEPGRALGSRLTTDIKRPQLT